jgi:germination protein YpeB
MRRPILVALVAALAVVSAWGLEQRNARVHLENLLNSEYQRSFYNTLAQVQSLEVLLGKVLVGGGGAEDADLLARTWQEAALAQRDLTQLPVQPEILARTSKFLNQTAEFTNLLLRQVSTGRPLTDEQWETLRQLQQQAGRLNTQLRVVERNVEADGVRPWELGRELRVRRGALGALPPRPVDNELEQLNREVERFPTLVYDGAFSDQLDRRVPRAASGPPITAAEARKRALAAVDLPDRELTARVIATTRGRIPSYRVKINDRRARGTEAPILVDVARRGGEVVWMLDTGTPGPPKLSIGEARKKAERYLEKRGRGDVEVVSSERQAGGTVTFNCVPRQNGVLLYTDVVKVTVALEDGRVTGLNAADYVMSHHARELPPPALNAEEAARGLNPRFRIENARLALIPTESGGEVLAWQLRGEVAGNTYLVFVNAQNGNREKILQVVETPEGTLTI